MPVRGLRRAGEDGGDDDDDLEKAQEAFLASNKPAAAKAVRVAAPPTCGGKPTSTNEPQLPVLNPKSVEAAAGGSSATAPTPAAPPPVPVMAPQIRERPSLAPTAPTPRVGPVRARPVGGFPASMHRGRLDEAARSRAETA